MITYIKENVRARTRRLSFIIYHLLFSAALITACQSDWHNGVEPVWSDQQVDFSATVSAGRMATRADGSLVNLKETSLPSTADRTYYRADAGGEVKATTKQFQAGLFGCYTGRYTWADLRALAAATSATELSEIPAFSDITAGNFNEKKAQVLSDYYTANVLYNVPADIEAAVGTTNELTYAPLRFWPNKRVDASNHEYMTFWAYYPYNATSEVGDYGIGIVNNSDGVGTGTGMGHVSFTMHPDAAQQNDFMISTPVTDRNRDTNPLLQDPQGQWQPRPVQFRFFHMLAQVRLYAFIRGTDKLVYKDDETYSAGNTYTDAWGKGFTVASEDAGKIPVIDEEKSTRWYRTDYLDINGEKKRADISYKMEFNNIKTSTSFYPTYNADGSITISYDDAGTFGSATVNHYIMNPYWFRFHDVGGKMERYMLNDNYMFGYFEDTPAYKKQDATDTDGINWTSKGTDPLHYLNMATNPAELQDPDDASQHYNYAPGNILMVVPQVLDEDEVPNIVLTATGHRAKWNGSEWEKGEEITAKVTINMLNMHIKWEPGFIYCYAIIDELHPGDDVVRGPESITVVFDENKHSDQW